MMMRMTVRLRTLVTPMHMLMMRSVGMQVPVIGMLMGMLELTYAM